MTNNQINNLKSIIVIKYDDRKDVLVRIFFWHEETTLHRLEFCFELMPMDVIN